MFYLYFSYTVFSYILLLRHHLSTPFVPSALSYALPYFFSNLWLLFTLIIVACIFISTYIFLNITCSICILLLTCAFSRMISHRLQFFVKGRCLVIFPRSMLKFLSLFSVFSSHAVNHFAETSQVQSLTLLGDTVSLQTPRSSITIFHLHPLPSYSLSLRCGVWLVDESFRTRQLCILYWF